MNLRCLTDKKTNSILNRQYVCLYFSILLYKAKHFQGVYYKTADQSVMRRESVKLSANKGQLVLGRATPQGKIKFYL